MHIETTEQFARRIRGLTSMEIVKAICTMENSRELFRGIFTDAEWAERLAILQAEFNTHVEVLTLVRAA